MPLDHFDPKNIRQINVTFPVLPAKNKEKRKGIFVTAVGGPGALGGFNCEDAVAKYYQTDGRAKTPK